MTFNIANGSYFGDYNGGFDPNGQSRLSEVKGKAVLYVFTPRNNAIGDVGLRSFNYDFDDNFIVGTQEMTDLAKRGTTSGAMIVDDMMSKVNFADHLLPSYQPNFNLRTSLLSENWRFILILTDSSSELQIGNTFASSNNSPSQVRRIYTGYFSEEPFNPTTFGSHRKTLNPHAMLTITHKTVVNLAKTYDQRGPSTHINTTSSEEIVHANVINNLAGTGGQGPLHLMTPDRCIKAVASNDEGMAFYMPSGASDISKDHGANVVADVLEQPTHNVGQIVRGMIQFQDEVSHRKLMSTRQVDRYFEDTGMQDGFYMSKLASSLALPRAKLNSLLDLDVDDMISAVDLDQRVNGALEVIDFDRQAPTLRDTADQMVNDFTNQYSFLIASVVGPILNSAGLNEMQLEYQMVKRDGRIIPDYRVYRSGSYWPLPEADLTARVRAVMHELTSGIFKTIFDSKGDFHVFINANSTGMTVVRLSLVEQGIRTSTDFEIPSFLGGIVSPLIGNDISIANNSSVIHGLFERVNGSSGYYDMDQNDLDFLNHANNLTFDSEAM